MNPRTALWLAVWAAGTAAAAEVPQASAILQVTELTVEPATVRLAHGRDRRTLLISGKTADGQTYDLSRDAKFETDNPIVRYADGRLEPVKAGKATVRLSAGGRTATVAVEVADATTVPEISYTQEIQPILSKGGCNMGACHGYSLGKNGFRLSLRGADHGLDYVSLTRDEAGRRINRTDPDASLLLRKSIGRTPHEGGVRLDAGSELYRTLRQWIAQGAADDSAKASALVEVKVSPEYRLVPAPGLAQQLIVTARYADGSVRDVTREAIYNGSADDVAEADEDGLVRTKVRGEAAITVRYERVIVVSRITVMGPLGNFVWKAPTERNYIDTHVFGKLKDLRIRPSDPTTDSEFLRRVYLDTVGIIPTPEEARAFAADTSADKRLRVIDALLERPEYVNHWSLKWADLLQNSRKYLTEQEVWKLRQWIREGIAGNKPFDRFVYELLTADGLASRSAPAAFYRVSREPTAAAERAAQLFCGIRMLCAKCHNHPFENWTQEDYYGLTSFFTQVSARKDVRDTKRELIFVNVDAPAAVNPRSRKVQAPRLLGGVEPKIDASADRREVFARWLVSPTNPYFARATVNRVWSYYFGRGIIEPVDDIRIGNPAANEPLLAALTKDFTENGYDIKRLMRTILNSQTYQLSARTNEFNRDDNVNFSHGRPRRLSAEQFIDSVSQATGVAESFPGVPAGFRAQELPDPQVASYVLDILGRPARNEACECERGNDSNMIQALHMINGKTLLDKMAGRGHSARLAAAKLTDRALVEELYLLTLSRVPVEAEYKLGEGFLKESKVRAEAVADLMWALLNSREFLFNN